MTFTSDLENGLKITTHPLFKSSVDVKYKPNRAKWNLYML